MAKDRIDRNGLADRIGEKADSARRVILPSVSGTSSEAVANGAICLPAVGPANAPPLHQSQEDAHVGAEGAETMARLRHMCGSRAA